MAKKQFKNNKDIGKRITKSLIGAGAGAAVSLLDGLLDGSGTGGNNDLLSVGVLAAGAALPAFVKGEIAETAGDSMVAVAGYKLGVKFDLAGKLGLSKTAGTTGIGERNMISATNVQRIFRNKKFAEGKSIPAKSEPGATMMS